MEGKVKILVADIYLLQYVYWNEVLSLFRSLLRTAGIFSDYNIREYAKRRTIDGFRQNRRLSDPSSIASAFYDRKSQFGCHAFDLYPCWKN
ncbi:LYR motif-containing protein 4B [Cinnamomum micranthum f. kanehirae]|uniref:LYR motif-containing protein 4B n=1 Tax=Cinnamomum micranthum f. kanehirae TaxID=337451 RepID=A0A443P1Y0_9MAGN|nr:LYR motif-containing protein 4B [Cinnamomum micranthum f. kanehirae]